MGRLIALVPALLWLCGCQQQEAEPPAPVDTPAAEVPPDDIFVFENATIWDGTGGPVRENATMVVANGRVLSFAPTALPDGTPTVDLQGAFVVPGLVNAHGHVNGNWADETTTDDAERIRDGLRLYARYGVTTVLSLGGEPDAAFTIGDSIDPAALDHARFYVAGPVVAEDSAATARAQAEANVELGVDWLKLRVDDDLGFGEKMPWEAVRAVLDVGQAAGVPVATHLFYLEDAERLLDMGTGLLAHSVRDAPVTEAFIDNLRGSDVCYVPTLTREVSTFVYADRPEFFDDPFFTHYANAGQIARVSDPEFMERMAASERAAGYRQALTVASENLATLARAGVRIAFGTDSGPNGRFPGYFEHMELEMMADAGMTPEQVLLSATRVAAECIGVTDVGTLEPGRWADFLVLEDNPLEDLAATRTLRNVFIAGEEVPR